MLLEQSSCQSYLKEELSQRIRTNPSYSQRAFAKHLGLSAGELSEVLRGKRNLSLKSAIKIAKKLGLNETETKHLLFLAQFDKTKKIGSEILESSKPPLPRELTVDLFHVVADWYCFSILNLADTEGFKWNLKYISKRLGITLYETEIALERLVRVGLIEKHGKTYRVVKDYVLSTGSLPSEAIRNYHRQILRKALESLDTQEMSEREISGIGLAFRPKDIPAIKKDIAEFHDQMIAKYAKKKGSEVYQLETSFFRLSQPNGVKK